jgi:hypothetical protein
LVGPLRNSWPDFLTTASYYSLLGRDTAFLGLDDNQYAIQEEDRTSLNLFNLKAVATKEALENNAAELEENTFARVMSFVSSLLSVWNAAESSQTNELPYSVESTLLYVISRNHIGLAKLLQGYRLSTEYK